MDFIWFGFYLSGIYWIVNSLHLMITFKILIPFGLIFIPFIFSFIFLLNTNNWVLFKVYNFSSLLFFSGTLALSDYIRAKILTGFPWNLWAYSWSWITEILQILNIIGFVCF